MKVRNTFVIFLVSGFWHGANWTFVVWGLLHALFIMPSVIFKSNRNRPDVVAQGNYLPSLKELFQMGLTFSLTVFALIFFRAENVGHAMTYITGVFSKTLVTMPHFPGIGSSFALLAAIVFFFLVEWMGREKSFAIEKLGFNWPTYGRWTFYYSVMISILYFAGAEQEFICFQF